MAIPVITVEDGTRVADANSYQDLACFVNFLTVRIGASDDVLALNSETKARGLIGAYDIMQPLDWLGERAYIDQNDAWPRLAFTDRRGRRHESNTIPEALLFGQARIAVALLDGRLIVPGMATPGMVRSISADGVGMTFAAPVIAGEGCAPLATDDPLKVCGHEMLALIRSVNRTLKLMRA